MLKLINANYKTVVETREFSIPAIINSVGYAHTFFFTEAEAQAHLETLDSYKKETSTIGLGKFLRRFVYVDDVLVAITDCHGKGSLQDIAWTAYAKEHKDQVVGGVRVGMVCDICLKDYEQPRFYPDNGKWSYVNGRNHQYKYTAYKYCVDGKEIEQWYVWDGSQSYRPWRVDKKPESVGKVNWIHRTINTGSKIAEAVHDWQNAFDRANYYLQGSLDWCKGSRHSCLVEGDMTKSTFHPGKLTYSYELK